MHPDQLYSKETPEQEFGEYPLLSQALRDGDCLHGFRSGGGLRVVNLKKAEGGYGEYPHIETALRYAEDDLEAGGREYGDFYGPVVDHYLTGSSCPSSELDAFVNQGRSFDVTFEDGEFVFRGKYIHDVRPPQEVLDRVVDTQEGEWWTNEQGIVLSVTPFTFPGNGAKGTSISVVENPTDLEGHKVTMQDRVHEVRSASLESLFLDFVGPA